MALDIKQYFFDSIEPSGEDPGDERIYPADEFVAGALRCLVTDGIYNGGSNCQIMETELAYTVAMLPGMAWIDGYYMNAAAKYGDSDERHLIQLAAPTGTVRCDRIVIRLNRDFTLEGRYIKPMVITGAEGSLTPPDHDPGCGNLRHFLGHCGGEADGQRHSAGGHHGYPDGWNSLRCGGFSA